MDLKKFLLVVVPFLFVFALTCVCLGTPLSQPDNQNYPARCKEADPSNRFFTAIGGCFDIKFNLVWSRQAINDGDYRYAENHCKHHRSGGFGGWRLPKERELNDIAGHSAVSKFIRIDPYNPFWSDNGGDSDGATVVVLADGDSEFVELDSAFSVVCVREGGDDIISFFKATDKASGLTLRQVKSGTKLMLTRDIKLGTPDGPDNWSRLWGNYQITDSIVLAFQEKFSFEVYKKGAIFTVGHVDTYSPRSCYYKDFGSLRLHIDEFAANSQYGGLWFRIEEEKWDESLLRLTNGYFLPIFSGGRYVH